MWTIVPRMWIQRLVSHVVLMAGAVWTGWVAMAVCAHQAMWVRGAKVT